MIMGSIFRWGKQKRAMHSLRCFGFVLVFLNDHCDICDEYCP
jgi:hypothetical protein